jgi:ketosteroid isomerase-like protein
MAEAERHFLSGWEDFCAFADEYRELDDERVLVFCHATGRGKISGLEIGQIPAARAANLFHVREGKVTKLVLYYDRDRALADLGLTPPADSRE